MKLLSSSKPTRRELLAALSAAGLGGCSFDRSAEGSTPQETTDQSPRTTTSNPTPTREGANADVHVMTDVSLLNDGWSEKWETEIVPSFQKRFDLTVSVDGIFQERRRVIDELLDAENPPEVLYGTIRETARHVVRGQTRAVGELVDDLEAANGPMLGAQFIESTGNTHLVPHGLVVGGVLNYRADIYEELGLSVPETWDGLLENARAIDDSEQFDSSGFAVAPFGSYFTPCLYTAGGSYWQWRDDTHVELAFREEHVRAALEMMQELRRYGPDPAETGYADMGTLWAEGGLGQCLWPNARLAEFAYRYADGDPEGTAIALETEQASAPLRDRTLDPPTRGGGHIEGTPLFRGANVDNAEQFLCFMYEGPSSQADKNNLSMKHLPPYEGIVETDEYAESAIYRAEDGHFLDLEKRLMEDVVPQYLGKRPRTPAAWYAMQPGSIEDAPVEQMVRSVLVHDAPVDDAIARARRRLQSRLEEGRQLQSR